MVRITEGCEIQVGAGQEPVEKTSPVLHPFEPGPGQRGQLADVAFGQVGQGSLRRDQTSSTGVSSCA